MEILSYDLKTTAPSNPAPEMLSRFEECGVVCLESSIQTLDIWLILSFQTLDIWLILKSPVYREVNTSGSDVHCILLIIYQYNFLYPKLSEFTHYLMVSESYSGIMEAFAKKKGKVGTRGAGQIIKENDESLIFYRFLFCTTLFA